MPNESRDILNNHAADYVAAVGKSLAGTIPFAGTFVGEIISHVIPGQRIERITKYLESLEKRVSELEINVQEKMEQPEYVDLFEEGCFQSCRALTENRLNYIVNLVSHGLEDNVLNYGKNKKMLKILHSLNDEEVLLLLAYAEVETNGTSDIFQEHPELRMEPPCLGDPREDYELYLIKTSYRTALEEKGLISPNFRRLRRGEMPEFDYASGKLKSSGYKVTALGRLFADWVISASDGD